MWFGQGPLKDYSYDGDVVYHEFGHSVVNVTLKLVGTPHMDEYGTSYSPGAMNEGLADYFSSAITGDPDVGEYAVQDLSLGLTAIRAAGMEAVDHRAHVDIGRHADEHQIAEQGDVAERLRRGDLEFSRQRGGLGTGAVPHGDQHAALGQMARHRFAHGAEANEGAA